MDAVWFDAEFQLRLYQFILGLLVWAVVGLVSATVVASLAGLLCGGPPSSQENRHKVKP